MFISGGRFCAFLLVSFSHRYAFHRMISLWFWGMPAERLSPNAVVQLGCRQSSTMGNPLQAYGFPWIAVRLRWGIHGNLWESGQNMSKRVVLGTIQQWRLAALRGKELQSFCQAPWPLTEILGQGTVLGWKSLIKTRWSDHHLVNLTLGTWFNMVMQFLRVYPIILVLKRYLTLYWLINQISFTLIQ